jgi:serine/threonine protein kinase
MAEPATAEDSTGDAELRGLRPVIELLDRVGAQMGKAAARPDGAPPEPDMARLLGDFSIVRVIGRGGMGVVYEAVQRSLNRRVALKILPSTSADDSRKVKRFLIEAQAAACLHHPHIIPVYLVGSENGLHYFAMQLIEGRTLAQIVAAARGDGEAVGGCADGAPRAPCSPREAAELARQAALALQFAHEQGIVHRDIKPSNLLINDSGWLWVGDFGLARIAGQADLTLSGAVLGTLRYMSPEQAFGARGIVEHRADVYSLGATLYELLTLRPVFEGDDRLELLRKIAEDEPAAPRRIHPAIPRDLETIVRKAMAKDPAGRYQTALELADDLGRFLDDLPILARPPGAISLAGRWAAAAQAGRGRRGRGRDGRPRGTGRRRRMARPRPAAA